jgi:YwiC-like protein
MTGGTITDGKNRDSSLVIRHIALPQDHGSWVFLLSPLLIGLLAGGTFSSASFLLILGCLAAFLARQPITIAVKIYSGRRPKRELRAARFWTLVYGFIGSICLLGLVWMGFGYILLLAIPGIPVFAWHLILVSRRAERRQMGVELIATGVLSLSAPAAMWVGKGFPDPAGWWLFILTWLQSAASIVYAYLRLEQRKLNFMPDLADRIRISWRAWSYATFNLAFTVLLGMRGFFSATLFLPFALQWLETSWGSLRPASGLKPTQIGLRQLIVSSLFTLLFILTWS